MPVVRMKRGVVMMGRSPVLFQIIDAAKAAYFPLGLDVVITSGVDGTHHPNSLHYDGKALDLRTFHIETETDREDIQMVLVSKLGADFDVLFEKDHFHIEYDPKG